MTIPEIYCGCGGLVGVEDSKILLVRRAAEPAFKKWSFPGGAVELGRRLGMLP